MTPNKKIFYQKDIDLYQEIQFSMKLKVYFSILNLCKMKTSNKIEQQNLPLAPESALLLAQEVTMLGTFSQIIFMVKDTVLLIC